MGRIELSDMIVGLRQELEEARVRGEKANLKFRVDSIDVEAKVTVSKEVTAEGKGKFKFWIFGEAEASAGGSVGEETVQTIRLSLSPVPPEGEEDLLISGKGPKPKR